MGKGLDVPTIFRPTPDRRPRDLPMTNRNTYETIANATSAIDAADAAYAATFEALMQATYEPGTPLPVGVDASSVRDDMAMLGAGNQRLKDILRQFTQTECAGVAVQAGLWADRVTAIGDKLTAMLATETAPETINGPLVSDGKGGAWTRYTLTFGHAIGTKGETVTSGQMDHFLHFAVANVARSFSVADGTGFWEGNPERTTIVTILSDDGFMLGKVDRLAARYARLFRQDCVMVETAGIQTPKFIEAGGGY
jgi:hypothetical protein